MIWVVGSSGMLGRDLGEALSAHGLEWIGSDREYDIRDQDALLSFASGRKIDWVCNCAAYTAVDKAEEEREAARSINALGAGMVAGVATRLGARLLHISTDYVFDGRASEPYAEDAPRNPLGVYGRTKAEGEILVARDCPRSFILRTAWLYGRHGPNFVLRILQLLKERESLTVVADQRGSPTWTRDLAGVVRTIIESGSEAYGIFHFTDEGDISWYEFACSIRDMGREQGMIPPGRRIIPISTEEYPAKAARPPYSVLSKAKIRSIFGVVPPRWDDSLREFLRAGGGAWTGL